MKRLEYIRQEWLAFVVAIMAPTVPILFFIGILIVADTFTGIWAAKKRNECILSFKMFNGIMPKVILYPLGIIIASGFEHLYPQIPAIKATAFIFISVEVKSLSENFSTILGMPFVKWLKILIFKGKKVYANEILNENKTPER